jgi:transposase
MSPVPAPWYSKNSKEAKEERLQRVVELRKQGLSNPMICNRLGVPASTIRNIIKRAKERGLLE